MPNDKSFTQNRLIVLKQRGVDFKHIVNAVGDKKGYPKI